MNATVVTLTREQLHEMVWAEPTSTVATRLGLSDRGLAKICMRLHVPLPGRGYWAKKAAGKEVWRARLRPLPDTTPTNERQVVLAGEEVRRRHASVTAAPRQQAVLEGSPEQVIRVADTLTDPHPLVERTARSLRRARGDHRGLLVPEAQRILDVRVTRDALDRAMRIADALVKALDERQYPISCDNSGERKTSVRVSEEEIALQVEEKIRRVEMPPPPRSKRDLNPYYVPPPTQYRYIATGELAIRITDHDVANCRRSWQDTPRQRLDTLLNRFILGLVAAAEAKKVERKRREEIHRQVQERLRQEEERRRLRIEEERKLRLLDGDLTAWAKSVEIREYVRAARAAADGCSAAEEDRKELHDWLEWVASYADRLDPTNRGTPPRERALWYAGDVR